jgi:type II secretory pathway pseudopilin PulG
MKMKQTIGSMLGVTLLEIMLVLAIASMIIVMSLRYYGSAMMAEQTTDVTNQIFSIVAAMETLAAAAGSYSGISTTEISNYLGGNAIKTVTGGEITVVPTNTPNTTFAIAMGLTAPICSSAAVRIKSGKITSASCEGTDKTTLNFTFDRTK